MKERKEGRKIKKKKEKLQERKPIYIITTRISTSNRCNQLQGVFLKGEGKDDRKY